MNMTILVAAGLAALLATAAPASASSISIVTSPFSGAYFTSGNPGTLLPDGSFVRVGTFTSVPSPVATWAELETLFREYATIQSGHPASAGVGRGMISRSGIADAPGGQPESYFFNRQVYIWVYNAPTMAAATGAGIFSSSSPVWVFPPDADAVPNSMSTSMIDLAFHNAYMGGQSAITPGSPNVYHLSVPEPTAAMLAALTTGLLAFRRRRPVA